MAEEARIGRLTPVPRGPKTAPSVVIALSTLCVLACGPSPSPVASPRSAMASKAPPAAAGKDATQSPPNNKVTLEEEMTFDDEEEMTFDDEISFDDEEEEEAPEPEMIDAKNSWHLKSYLSGERATDVPSGSTARRENDSAMAVRPRPDVIRDLEAKGYAGIVTFVTVCVGPEGNEIYRKSGKTPYPDWDRLVVELSYQHDTSWLKPWPEKTTNCTSWLVEWTERDRDAIDYSTYVIGRPATKIPDKHDGKRMQDETPPDMADLSIKPPRGVLGRMKKAGKTTITTTVVVCADSKGKTLFREVGKTPYSAYDQLVLKASHKLALKAKGRPQCSRWTASWKARAATP